MLIPYMDTSSVVKLYRPELGSGVVRQLFWDRSRGDLFVASKLVVVELESALARLVRNGGISRTSYTAYLGSITSVIEDNLLLLDIDQPTLVQASDVARTYGLRSLDAIHLATAQRVRNGFRTDILIVSSDGELLDAAKADGFTTLNPTWPDAAERLAELRGHLS